MSQMCWLQPPGPVVKDRHGEPDARCADPAGPAAASPLDRPGAPGGCPASCRCEGRDWLRVDEAYAPQMALRDRLIAAQPEVVHAPAARGAPAADELYATVLDWLPAEPGFAVGPDARHPPRWRDRCR